jgi:RHS repeat-associated protein
VWDALYRPFGEVHAITGTASNNLRFPGQYFLIESGLHYNWHRHYDPTIGRYIQADPLGFVNGPSLYSYANTAPTQYIDRDGRLAWWVIPVVLAGGNLAWQLYQSGGQISCVNLGEVAFWGLSGLGLNRLGWAAIRNRGIDPNKLHHIFGKSEHGLDKLVAQFGSEAAAYRAVEKAVQRIAKDRGLEGIFETTVKVGSEYVVVRGKVINGIVRIGTMFTP